MLRLIRRLLFGILALAVLVICGTYAFRTLMTPAVLCDECNVILVSLDAISAESVADDLPLLAKRAAQEGVVFTHAYAPAKRQLEGHAAILTGAYPWDIGLMREARTRIPQDVPLISEILSSYGYATAGFVEGSLVDTPWGFSRGFLDWNHPAPRKAQSIESFFVAASEWIRARASADAPYFLYLNPYDIYSFFDADGTQDGFTYADLSAAAHGDMVALTRAREGYARKLGVLDSHLDTTLAAAQTGGNGRKTVVVIVGSYGEYLTRAPQEEIGSMQFPKSRALNVPLIFFVPDIRAKELVPTVESKNVASTILEIVGGDSGAVSGTSLASYVRTGAGGNQLVRSYVANAADEKLIEPPEVFYSYIERAYLNPVPELESSDPSSTRGYMFSLIYDVWHLVKDGAGVTHLFNTVHDPKEKTNLADKVYTLTPYEQQSIGVLMGALIHTK